MWFSDLARSRNIIVDSNACTIIIWNLNIMSDYLAIIRFEPGKKMQESDIYKLITKSHEVFSQWNFCPEGAK
mgnify:CR=1 FL=1